MAEERLRENQIDAEFLTNTEHTAADHTGIPGVPASGAGQTDSVAGATGIVNSGDNVDAVLTPTYGTSANTIAEGDHSHSHADTTGKTATDHHSNTNDPTTDEKAAMTAANSPASGNAFATIADLPIGGGQTDTIIGSQGITNAGNNVNALMIPVYGTALNTIAQGNHIHAHADTTGQTATDHHDNANDPTSDQKDALDGANSPDSGNVFATMNDVVGGTGTFDEVQDEGTPVAGSPHDTINFVGAGVAATDGTGGVVTVTIPGGSGGQTNTVGGATGITNTGDNVDAVLAPTYGTGANQIAEGNHTHAHADTTGQTATDHHDNANDPTSDQKAAMDGATSPSATNPFLTEGNFTAAGDVLVGTGASAFTQQQLTGNSKYLGTNAGGTVGVYDLPSGGAVASFDAVVDPAGGADYTTIKAAITAGHLLIRLMRGTYAETAGNIILPPGCQLIGPGGIGNSGTYSATVSGTGGA